MKKASFLLLTSFISLYAQIIKEIKFEGLVHISKAIALEAIDIKPGDNLDLKKIDKSIKTLFKQQYFQDIWVEEKNGVLIYHFKEKPIIAQVTLTGYEKNKTEEMLNIIGLQKGDIYDKSKIEDAKSKIITALEAKGYFDSIVEEKVEYINEGSVRVELIVNRGENIYIKSISFYGNKNFDYDDFEPYLANREREFLGWLWGRNDGELKIHYLEYDYLKIRDFYFKNGYLDAKVSPPFLRVYFENYLGDLSYNIEEGKPYVVKSVEIEDLNYILDIDELQDELKLKKSKIFNVEKLRYDIAMLTREIADKGYAFAQVIPDVKQNRQEYTAEVVYKINPGAKVTINNILISGNLVTLDKVIRREIYLAEGDTFSQTNLQDSLNALRRTGFFDDVKIDIKRVQEDKVDLLVKVQEAPTGTIMGSIGYGSYDGLLLTAALSDKNFLGSGNEVGVNIDYSAKSLKGRISFYNPRVFDSLFSLHMAIFRRNYKFYNYYEQSAGGNVSLGRKVGRNVHIYLTYLYEDSKLSDLSDSLKNSIYYTEGSSIKSAIKPSIVYDNTDNYYNPRKGFVVGLNSEYAGIGGDEKFIKNRLYFNYYYGLQDILDYDLIFRMKLKGSTIKDNGNLPINEKFYLGGIGSLRGYDSGSLSPKNSDGDLVGGKRMFSGSLEISIPLIESARMRALVFYDYGMIGDENFDDIKRSSAGAGIEWMSPMGPLQFFYSWAIDNKKDDKLSNIEFMIGRRF